jgi:hypothetical protein
MYQFFLNLVTNKYTNFINCISDRVRISQVGFIINRYNKKQLVTVYYLFLIHLIVSHDTFIVLSITFTGSRDQLLCID